MTYTDPHAEYRHDPPKPKKKDGTRIGIRIAGFFGLLILAGLLSPAEDEPTDAASTAQGDETTATPSPTVEDAADNDEESAEQATDSTQEPTEESATEEPEPELTLEEQLIEINDTAELLTGEPDDLWIQFDLRDSFTTGMIRAGAQRDTLDFLRAVAESDETPSMVHITGKFPTSDQYGNESDSIVLNLGYEASTLERINFENIVVDTIWEIADG